MLCESAVAFVGTAFRFGGVEVMFWEMVLLFSRIEVALVYGSLKYGILLIAIADATCRNMRRKMKRSDLGRNIDAALLVGKILLNTSTLEEKGLRLTVEFAKMLMVKIESRCPA